MQGYYTELDKMYSIYKIKITRSNCKAYNHILWTFYESASACYKLNYVQWKQLKKSCVAVARVQSLGGGGRGGGGEGDGGRGNHM
jgi:hypothetical protein